MNYIVYFRSKCSAFITWTENSPRGHRKFLTVKVWRRVWACFSLLSVINVTWMKTLSRRFSAAGLKFLRFRFMWRQRTRPPAGEKKRTASLRAQMCAYSVRVKTLHQMTSLWWRTDVQENCHTCSYFSIYWIESVFFFRWHTWCVRVCLSSFHLLKHNSHQQEEEGGRRAEVWAAQHAAGKEDGGKDAAGCSGSQI